MVTPGGLIFLTIVVLWAVYLVPVWARDRARVAAVREAQRESERLRRNDRSQPRVLLSAGRPMLTTTARIGALASAQRDLAGQRRVLRRRRAGRAVGLLLGLLSVVGAGIAVAVAVVPWWSLGLAGAWVAAAAVAGAVGAGNDRRQIAAARTRVRLAASLQPSVAVAARPVALFDRGPELVERATVPDAVPRQAGELWTPVTIPRPTYTMAARVTHAPTLPWVESAPAPLPQPRPLATPEPATEDPQRWRAATG